MRLDQSVPTTASPELVTIRLGNDHDGPRLGPLFAAIFSEYPGCLYVEAEFPEFRAISSHYRLRGGVIWLAEAGDTLIGCCAVMRSTIATRFELSKVYLARRWRGTGLAQNLVGLAEQFARENGGTEMELFSDTRFLGAHKFYRKLGFLPVAGERYLADASHSWEYHYCKQLKDPSTD